VKEAKQVIRDAELAWERDKDCRAFHRALGKLVLANNPEAIYLSSTKMKPRETVAQFEMRRFWCLHQAARFGHAESLYCLGVHYDGGDLIIKNGAIASVYFRLAAEQGHPEAKFNHALDLINGSNGIKMDAEEGLRLLNAAAALGVVAAKNELNRLRKT